MPSRRIPARRCGWCALLALLLLPLAPARADEDVQRFEQFLTRLGLVNLQAAYLEEQLDANLPEDQRQQTAKRLADLYAGQLVAYAGDREKYQQTVASIDHLIERFPTAKTPSLEVMLLQADYYRAEQLINKWLADHKQTEARDEAGVILGRIAPQLATSYAELKKATEALYSKLETSEEGDERDSTEQQLSRLESVAGQAGYFAGWSNYYVAVAQAASDASAFARAAGLFRELLSLPDDYDDVEPESLGLESIWRSRAVIGLGLAEAGAGNLAATQQCFDWLDTSSAPPEIRDQAPYWHLQALLNSGQNDAAGQLAAKYLGELSGAATPGKVGFCVTLVRAGFGRGTPTDASRKLGMQGIAGLIRLRQNAAVRQLMEQYDIEVDSDAGFYMRWIKGQQLFEQAEQSKQAEQYEAAAAQLEQALAAPESQSDLGGAGQCRSQLAWCYYRLERFEDAARMFEKAAAGRKAASDPGAVESAWMAFVAYQRLAKDQPRFVSAAIDVLTQIQRDFPQHEYAKRAAYHIGKLRSNAATPEETLATLERVPPESANYLSARYDICNLLHEQWSKAAAADKPAAATKLNQSVDQYLQAARSVADEDSRARAVKVCLLAVDAALGGPSPDSSQAARYLERAGGLAAGLPPENSVAAEYHFRAYQLARQTNDDQATQQHAQWLAENGRGTPFEVAGLVSAATAVDGEIAAAGDRATRQQLEEALGIYERLTELFGDSPGVIREKKNARVAASKAADYAQRLGRYTEAAAWLDKLIAGTESPDGTKDRDYVRRAGLAWYGARDFDQSLPHWRTLLAGLKKGSPEWFEAKYYQLACLAESDPPAYREVRDQFKLLYPKVPAPWDEKIKSLP